MRIPTGPTVGLGLGGVSGALVPTPTPVTVETLTGHLPQSVPAQIFFGPAAFCGYLVPRRRGTERCVADVRPPATPVTAERALSSTGGQAGQPESART
ncbi:hypothetical protein AB0L50_35400 [Streptomyces flaveolus]|uniref:hypothetical protein n=1 Tax=Streptomyces flaveolus TaxID=67297 RepID=UPI003430146A